MTRTNTQIALLLLVDVGVDAAREDGQVLLDVQAAARRPAARARRLVGAVLGPRGLLRQADARRTIGAVIAGAGFLLQLTVTLVLGFLGLGLAPMSFLLAIQAVLGYLAALIYMTYRGLRALLWYVGNVCIQGYVFFLYISLFPPGSPHNPQALPALLSTGAAVSFVGSTILVTSRRRPQRP